MSLRESRRLFRDAYRKPWVFDPSGLKSARRTTERATTRRLNAVTPTHFDEGEWVHHLDEIEASCQRRGVPMTLGRLYKWDVPVSYNKVQW